MHSASALLPPEFSRNNPAKPMIAAPDSSAPRRQT